MQPLDGVAAEKAHRVRGRQYAAGALGQKLHLSCWAKHDDRGDLAHREDLALAQLLLLTARRGFARLLPSSWRDKPGLAFQMHPLDDCLRGALALYGDGQTTDTSEQRFRIG